MKRLAFIFLLLMSFLNGNSLGHFIPAYEGNGQNHMNINIISATISGLNLEAGDEIAVFDGAICCGVLVLDQPVVFGSPATYKVLKASKQDPGEANGYTDGHIISYKIWDSSSSLEISGIVATYINPLTQAIIPAPTFAEISTIAKLSISGPTANAGQDKSAYSGTLITLDGSASADPNGASITYLWSSPTGITLNSNTVQNPTFIAPQVVSNTNYSFSLVVNNGNLNSLSDQVMVTVFPSNGIPNANAGSDQSLNEGALVTLNGSGSSDPEGGTLSYIWTAPNGIILNSNTVQKPTFTAPEVSADTPFTFTLVVSDGTDISTADQVVITVRQVNKNPIANAGADQSINEGTNVTLDGSASSDPDGTAVTYSWTAPTGITLNSATAQKPTFTAPEVAINTNYTFSLVVSDGSLNSAIDQVVITIRQVNKNPVANAGNDQSLNEGAIVTLDGSGSFDPDGTAVTYQWTAPSGITLNSTTAQKPTFTAPEVTINTNYTFSLVVSDGALSSVIDQVVVTVLQLNASPISNAGIDQSINEGTLVTLDGSASSDPEGTVVTYLWTAPAGITLSSATAQKPTFTAPEVALNTNYTFSLIVSDGPLSSIADQVVITVRQVNKNPIANAGIDQSINEGTVVTLDGSASSDPDGAALNYQWTPPPGISLSSTTAQKPTFTAPEVAANTTYTFSLVVSDGSLNSTIDQVIITVRQVNKNPVANSGVDQLIDEGSIVTLDGSASYDADLTPLTYLWTPPAGVTLSSTTAQKPTFTAPEVATNTNLVFSLVVNDGSFNSNTDFVIITVKQVNKIPVAHAGVDQEINENTIISLDGSGSTDPDNDAITYLWTSPNGITLNSSTVQKPTFTAPEVTSNTQFTFDLVVNDGKEFSVIDQVIITVKQVNKTPFAHAGADQSQNEGTLVTLDGSLSTDPEGSNLSYLWTPPAGITLSSNTVQKPTFIAPEIMTTTNISFSLVVSDGTLSSVADQVTIIIRQINKAPVSNAGIDQLVNENSIYTLDASASFDPDNDLISYSWVAPPGITLSSISAQKPTFTAPEVSVNTNYIFSLTVNDGTLVSNTDQVIITVKQGNKLPVANAGPDQTVAEGSTVTLSGLNSFDPDFDPLVYTWSAPIGIILNQASASTPTFTAPEVSVDTNYSISLIVNDGSINSVADQVTITVRQVNKAPLANAGPDQTINERETVTLNGSSSYDPDGTPLTYLWTAPPGITLSSNTTQKPTFTSPEVESSTNYTFSLVVSDGLLNSGTDQVVITVAPVNRAPIANAGIDKSFNEGAVVILDGSTSSDPDGNSITFNWTAPAGVTLNSATDQKPTFSAPNVQENTSYIFNLTVSDGMLNSTPDQVVITVNAINNPPIANAGPDQTPNEGTPVILDGSASNDPDGNTLTYNWIAPNGIVLNSTTTQKPTFIAPIVTSDTSFSFTLVVSDGLLSSSPDQVIITVRSGNKVPIANAGSDQIVSQNQTVNLSGSLSYDPDNNPLTYHWSSPMGIPLSNSESMSPTFKSPAVLVDTDLIFKLTVNDGLVNSAEDEIIIRVIQRNLPIANAGSDFSANEGSIVSLDGSLSHDTGSGPVSMKWTSPEGISLSSATAIKPNFLAPEVKNDTPFTFSLIVFNGVDYSLIDQVTIIIKNLNKTPIANAGTDITVNEGSIVSLNGSNSYDPDGESLNFSWIPPLDIKLNSTSEQKPTFIAPEISSDTPFIFWLKVNDGKAESSIDEVIITVKQLNKIPVAYSGTNQTVAEKTNFILDGSRSFDADGDKLTYQWTAPAGIILSSNFTDKPSFITPDVDKTTSFNFSLIVNDGKISSPASTVTITVIQENVAPIYISPMTFIVNEDEPFEILLEGNDVNLDPISFSIENLSPNLKLTKKSIVSAVLSGAFSNSNVGNNIIKLQLTDGILTSSITFTIKVNNIDDPPYLIEAIQNFSVDKGSSEKIIDFRKVFADDDIGDQVAYSVIGNSNPDIITPKIVGSYLILSFSPSKTGFSIIRIKAASNGKEVSSEFQVEVKLPVGIEPVIDDMDIQVYPNPAKESVFIKFSDIPKSGTKLYLYNSQGKAVYQKLTDKQEELINVQHLAPGLYFLQIDKSKSKIYKVLIE